MNHQPKLFIKLIFQFVKQPKYKGTTYILSDILAYPKKKKKPSKFKWSAFNNLYIFLKKLLKRTSSRLKKDLPNFNLQQFVTVV